MISIVLANSSQEPLYKQIVEQIKRSILDGKIEPRESLPSIRVLAAELGISVITTKRAYDELENEGLIETFPGKGCFAAGDNELLRERRLSILEELLEEALSQADYLDLSVEDLITMITTLKEEADAISS